MKGKLYKGSHEGTRWDRLAFSELAISEGIVLTIIMGLNFLLAYAYFLSEHKNFFHGFFLVMNFLQD